MWNEAKVILRRKFISSNACIRGKGLTVNDLGIYLKKLGKTQKNKSKKVEVVISQVCFNKSGGEKTSGNKEIIRTKEEIVEIENKHTESWLLEGNN